MELCVNVILANIYQTNNNLEMFNADTIYAMSACEYVFDVNQTTSDGH